MRMYNCTYTPSKMVKLSSLMTTAVYDLSETFLSVEYAKLQSSHNAEVADSILCSVRLAVSLLNM